MHLSRFACLAMALFLAGCGAQLPPLNFSVPNVGPTGQKIEAEVRSITVTMGRPDEVVGEMAPGVEVVAGLWQTSLIEALNRFVIFRDEAPKRVSIAVKVLKFDIPEVGAEMVTETTARYEIIDRSNGDIIFTQDITAKGITPFDHAFLGVIRARESINRSVQNNIGLFLQALPTVDISKPMFPAGTTPPPPKRDKPAEEPETPPSS
jgi:hypothetical protein